MTGLLLLCGLVGASGETLLAGVDVPRGEPVLVVRGESASRPITFLSWDTEGGNRAAMNLLYAPVSFSVQSEGMWSEVPADSPQAGWSMVQEAGKIVLRVRVADAHLERVRFVFPFEPRSAATTFIPMAWSQRNEMQLPGIISAPDFGQMLLTVRDNQNVRGSLFGSRVGKHTVDLRLEWPVRGRQETAAVFVLEPLRLAKPAAFPDQQLWLAIRRGWFNMLQPSCQWGEPGRRQSAPPGLLSNNVVSDPVSCVLHMMADHVLLQPDLAPQIKATVPLRNTLDWWLDNGIAETGEMRSWRNVQGMLDANAGPLIGAWCYVEASGDTGWLSGRIGTLEFLADYLAGRDRDGNGLVESVYSGNYGTQIGRLGASAYDTINSGHEDAYLNALTYRAWRCLADLERKLGRSEPQQRYSLLADRLKAVYRGRFYNPKTGWLAWWLSEDGQLHDVSSPMITSIAVMYGLVRPDDGRLMMDRLWNKIEAVGFDRFALGVPLTLEPVRKGDYSLPRPGEPAGTYGRPLQEDGSDTFQQYLNGGCCVSDAYYFLTAWYTIGERERADRILAAMLKRQVEGVFENGGGFQNGVVDAFPHGAEFYDWQGNTTGYEGHLVYSFSFLQAVLYRDESMRRQVLRPLLTE